MGATTPLFGLVWFGLVWLVWFGREGYNHTRRIVLSQPQLNFNLKQHNLAYLGFDTNIGVTTTTAKTATTNNTLGILKME